MNELDDLLIQGGALQAPQRVLLSLHLEIQSLFFIRSLNYSTWTDALEDQRPLLFFIFFEIKHQEASEDTAKT